MTTRAPGRALVRRDKPVRYPESDGKPMAETPEHRNLLMDLIRIFQEYYAGRDDVYVSGNMMMYHIEGNPRRSFSSDVFVTIGAPRLPERRVYKVWEEGPPTVVFELTSASSRTADRVRKRDLYAGIGVREYFIYDPLREYLRPPLQGFRLVNGAYEPLPPSNGGAEALVSEQLGVRLEPSGETLRVVDLRTGERILPPHQRAVAADERARLAAEWARIARERVGMAEERAHLAEQRASVAEERLAVAEERTATAETRTRVAEETMERTFGLAQQAVERAETETRLRTTAEARNAELERRLREMGSD